jgi:putative Holliday junction resolvase
MLEICLPSSIEYLPLVDTLSQAFCTWSGISEEAAQEISIAVVEAATNAVVHGNRCLRSKKMRATFEKTPSKMIITITDEGEGFDPDRVPDPTDESNLLKESGRGIFIMRQVMDSVEFSTSPSGGTVIKLSRDLETGGPRRVLCIDYGRKRLGLALSDELGVTAQPLGKIEEDSVEDRMDEIERICEEKGVTEVVVGLPLTMKGEVAQAASRVIAFARDLNQRLGLPVITWDERLSTKEGEKALLESGMRRNKRKQVVDSVAAAIILQSFLDARREK